MNDASTIYRRLVDCYHLSPLSALSRSLYTDALFYSYLQEQQRTLMFTMVNPVKAEQLATEELFPGNQLY
jgi:hypothetical protein